MSTVGALQAGDILEFVHGGCCCFCGFKRERCVICMFLRYSRFAVFR